MSAKKTQSDAKASNTPIWMAEKVVQSLISQIKPYANNNRVHAAKNVDKLKASVAQFGFVTPILLDGSGTIIAGHGRYEAAKDLRKKRVPILVDPDVSHEDTEAFIKALTLHNKQRVKNHKEVFNECLAQTDHRRQWKLDEYRNFMNENFRGPRSVDSSRKLQALAVRKKNEYLNRSKKRVSWTEANAKEAVRRDVRNEREQLEKEVFGEPKPKRKKKQRHNR